VLKSLCPIMLFPKTKNGRDKKMKKKLDTWMYEFKGRKYYSYEWMVQQNPELKRMWLVANK